MGRHRIARLMRENGITARYKRRYRRTTDSNHQLPITDNLLRRRFEADAPDKVWAADITYLWTDEGWLYLAVIIDLFSRAVVGWSMDSHMRTELVLQALNMALGQRQPEKGLIFHSDRGVQYASKDYKKALEAHSIVPSMSRKGDCWDNAVAESFFGTIKTEKVYRTRWYTRAQAKLDVFKYIEVWYNRKRRHSYVGNKSPMTFETVLLSGGAKSRITKLSTFSGQDQSYVTPKT